MQVDPTNMKGGGAAPTQVSHGLNLTLELNDPRKMPLLLAQLQIRSAQTRVALNELHFVHFARFLPARGNTALLVITEFDGPLEPYVMDFVIAIGDVFTLILSYVKGAEEVESVKEHPRAFWEFIKKNNCVVVVPGAMQWDDYPIYSAYAGRTVLDIVGRRTTLPPPVTPARTVPIDFADVQGNILRGHRASLARHYALEIESAKAARAFLAEIVDGDGSALPRVTSAEAWPASSRPAYFLNVGITASGLAALGVSDETRASFPAVFREGPAEAHRAAANGDTGASAPDHWVLGSPTQPVHVLVSLYGDYTQEAEFERRAAQLTARWEGGGWRVVHIQDAAALPDDQVHFGYRDGLAQPRIAGVHDENSRPDMQPRANAGEFLLGATYPDIYGGMSLDPLPAALCQNATYAAVRMLEQDVAAFEKLLDETSAAHKMDRELIAAKMMGRCRNGTPLARGPVLPSGDMPPPSTVVDSNDFDYAPSRENPFTENDHEGLRCPVGSHARRMNPRSALVAGKPHSRRIIRRGLPYGPLWDGGKEPTPRGLYGMFICSDLERQFEFLMQTWANGDTAASGIRGTQDPIIGEQAWGGEFRFPVAGAADPVTLTVPRLVTTRGSLYLLLPGLSGLRHLAGLSGGREEISQIEPAGTDINRPGKPRQHTRFDPARFDPKDPRFLADPYRYYAAFRNEAPVARVQHGGYTSYWVFSHELVTQVCDDTALFLKQPAGTPLDNRGLFYMDPPRHGPVRSMLDPLFAQATADIAQTADQLADEAIADINAQGRSFNLIPAYARRVARNVFMSMFGVPRADWEALGMQVETVLAHFDQMLPAAQRAPAAEASMAILSYFAILGMGCPAHASSSTSSSELLCLMASEGKKDGLSSKEAVQTALHFALGGYLSTEFLIGTGFFNLLSRGGAAMAQLRDRPEGLANAIEEMKRFDAPFQMADRYTAEATRLGGCDIPANALVTVVYGSANRDTAVFGADADQFLIDRVIPAGKNYVFGHGIHRCIGAPMVASIAPVVFDKLIKAMPNLRLAEEAPSWLPDPYFRALAGLELKR